MPGGNERAYIFKQTGSFKICLGIHDFLFPSGIKGEILKHTDTFYYQKPLRSIN